MVELFKAHSNSLLFKGLFAQFYLKEKSSTKMLPTQGYPPSSKTNKDSASWLVHSSMSVSCRLFPKLWLLAHS
ncbi:unnamed protein product [Staurois parvus]|uniref:Uncharacterized protein n=1 Tax=Staurois parvus TaxID=386267 RepID=A0ABN9B760_9NEOB|nr:unnamed protein product [Staurois parvus]